MRSLLLTALPPLTETRPFAANVARAEISRRVPDHASRAPFPPHGGWVQVEFFAADAASWRACQIALYQAFPATSGLRGDLKTGIFELPASCTDDLVAWLTEAFEAPVVEHGTGIAQDAQEPLRPRTMFPTIDSADDAGDDN